MKGGGGTTEWERREAGPESLEEIKVRSEKKRGVRDPVAEVARLISPLLSQR